VVSKCSVELVSSLPRATASFTGATTGSIVSGNWGGAASAGSASTYSESLSNASDRLTQAKDRNALKPILNDPTVKSFLKGRDKAADVALEFKKHKKDFDFSQFGVRVP